MTGENNPYISNLFVDSDEHSLCTDVFLREGGRLYTGYDEHSVILILDKCSVGFRISRGGFRIPDFVNRTWTPDSCRQWDSEFLELYSGFQSQRFFIWPQPKTSRISQFLGSRSPRSGLRSLT